MHNDGYPEWDTRDGQGQPIGQTLYQSSFINEENTQKTKPETEKFILERQEGIYIDGQGITDFEQITEDVGEYYTFREVNRHVHYLLKTMNEVGQKIPFKGEKMAQEIDPPEVTFWPYGIRLEYKLPVSKQTTHTTGVKSTRQPVTLTVHLKDPDLIQKGKRWSQVMYFNYLLGYNWLQGQESNLLAKRKTHDVMFLALDGDIDFHPDALTNCIDKLQAQKDTGVVCGKIHPKGSSLNPLIWYQKFEYAVGHWFQKSTEHVLGSVLCSPGCFSLMKGEALIYDIKKNKDSAVDVYGTRADKNKPIDIIQWNQGEDRWLCTLLIKRGWSIKYVAISHQDTNAPETFKEFFNQRRRWGPSSLFNTFDIISDWKKVVEYSESISSLYLIYTSMITFFGLLTPSTVCLMLIGVFDLLLQTWGCSFCTASWLPYFLALAPPIIFGLICLFSSDDNPKHTSVLVLSWFYAMVMLSVFFTLFANIIAPCGVCILSNQVFLLVIAFYLLAGLLAANFRDFLSLLAGLVYWLFIPTMLTLLRVGKLFRLPK